MALEGLLSGEAQTRPIMIQNVFAKKRQAVKCAGLQI